MTDFLAQYMDPELAGWLGMALLAALALLILYIVIRTISGARERKHRAQNARISIVDVEDVDGRRRLVLVRRDKVEHLIMIGGANDLVIEGGIGETPIRAAPSTVTRPQPVAVAPQPTAPRRMAEATEASEPSTPPTNVTPLPTPEPNISSAPVVTAPARPAPVQPKPERKEPVLPTPETPTSSVDEGRRNQLDGEIQELLAQMGQKPPTPPSGN